MNTLMRNRLCGYRKSTRPAVSKIEQSTGQPIGTEVGVDIGNRRYPHSTALGKGLISELAQRDVMRLIRAKGMPRFTPATIVTEEALWVELEKVRTQGFALDNTENEAHGRCIAAPIFDNQRKVLAGVSISGPLPRMTMVRAKGFLKELTATCRTIGENL